MKPLDHDRIVQLFAESSAQFTAEGFFGADLYEQLANDPALPENFEPPVCAAILNVLPSAMAQRRKRGDPPSFLRLAQNSVVYPRHAFCMWLRDRFVERRPALAKSEYTQIPAEPETAALGQTRRLDRGLQVSDSERPLARLPQFPQSHA